ncbi:MAG: hypothetical protein ACOY0T_14245 [Myxococcota bacterium]
MPNGVGSLRGDDCFQRDSGGNVAGGAPDARDLSTGLADPGG